ncbi:MAG TPA: hypothetical protein VFO58_14460 [Vicinamibacterales bacterium]|nr:hypothetical protein [Vicinamibacterales bacterium]
MMTAARGVGLVVPVYLLLASPALVAQESKSAAVVRELTQALDQLKLDAIAAKHGPERYVAALYIAGSQLLVIAAKYSVPARLDSLIAKREYQEVYADLSSASEQASKMFVMDLGANGLRFKRETNEPFDTVDTAAGSVAFNGERGKLSEDDYKKVFTTNDEQYASMIQALVAELKKPS